MTSDLETLKLPPQVGVIREAEIVLMILLVFKPNFIITLEFYSIF